MSEHLKNQRRSNPHTFFCLFLKLIELGLSALQKWLNSIKEWGKTWDVSCTGAQCLMMSGPKQISQF